MAAVDDIAAATIDAVAVDGSLAGGSAGLAVFLAYVAHARQDERLRSAAAHFLGQAIQSVRSRRMGSSLYSGLTGVGWALEHLKDRLPVAANAARAVDGALIRHVDRSPWPGEYDLVGGLVGIGVYARERLPEPDARTLLGLVVDRLTESAERAPSGTTWLSVAASIPVELRRAYPAHYYNLGLAHGVPGVAALLAVASAAGIERARPLLDETVAWILGQRLSGQEGVFARWQVLGEEPGPPARSAWCYGDPGVAAALLVAARAAREPSWERAAVDVARVAAARPPDEAGVRDAALCHGAAGLGHLFNRMHQATSDPLLADAARSWFAKALDLRGADRSVSGVAAVGGGDQADKWEDVSGLLTGAAGIGLALLAATTAEAPAWDRFLLVS